MKLVTKLLHSNARLPERGHDIDVGLDVFTPEAGLLLPGPNKIPLGFSIEVPIGYSAEIRPRSGMASGEKTLDFVLHYASPPITVFSEEQEIKPFNNTVKELHSNGVAIIAQSPPIDPGYTGEVHAIVFYNGKYPLEYPAHTRFGQLVVYPVVYAVPCEAVDTSRGVGGFGSTGA